MRVMSHEETVVAENHMFYYAGLRGLILVFTRVQRLQSEYDTQPESLSDSLAAGWHCG